MTKFEYDNTEKVKRESAANTRAINFIEDNVSPIKSLSMGIVIVGEVAYSINGQRGIVESIDNSSTITVNGYFQRKEEWKSTPWTDDEKELYWTHRKVESERVQRETTRAYKALEERNELAKAFTGR